MALRGVLAMAPAADLAYLHGTRVCDHVVDGLMGGSPNAVPERYRWADPVRLGPDGVPQTLLFGRYDDDWNPAGERYLAAARARGDDVRKVVAEASGHFEIIDPDSSSWAIVRDVAKALIHTG